MCWKPPVFVCYPMMGAISLELLQHAYNKTDDSSDKNNLTEGSNYQAQWLKLEKNLIANYDKLVNKANANTAPKALTCTSPC